MKSRFSTREVAKIVELPEWRIRSCVRAEFLAPSRGPKRRIEFTFQDLLVLKTTKALLESRVAPKRIRAILQSLKQQLPAEKDIWNVTVYTDGKRVVVWDGSARWQPDSGQFLFNFAAREVAKRLRLPVAAASIAPALSAQQWFDLGCELEKNSPEEARRAYDEALSLDPTLAVANINLGRLCHQAQNFYQAETHYRAAIAHSPHEALAHFNLGVLLEDRGRTADAIGAYRTALASEPEFADAHYNLALIFEARGLKVEAIRHFQAARRLYGPLGNLRR